MPQASRELTFVELAQLEACGFAELLGTMHALRFTGPVLLHFLNGQPQMAELGRPLQVRFPEHPANKGCAKPQNPVDKPAAEAPSSVP